MKAVAGLSLFLLLVGAGSGALAENPGREAGKHFQRGVDLYQDGDFRGALVEFKKAYTIWPRANVLYDIGQTEYQLLDYASALKTMERYLAETGPNAAHRAEVEATVESLRGRVGKVALDTDADACEVSVDDQPAGTTPLEQSLLVSVGPRKISVACSGRGTISRHVEVAAGELVRVELRLPAPAVASVRAPTPPVETRRRVSKTGLVLAWTMSGLLSAATIGVGTATLVEQSRLTTLRQTYPTTREALDHQSGLVTALAIASDALGVASAVAIGVSTYFTIKYGKEDKEQKVRLSWTGSGVSLRASF
jgi:hypothetical protein